MTGMGSGSKIHQTTHNMATAAVIAKAVLLAAADVLMIRKYISSAANGPENSVMVLVFTLLLWFYIPNLKVFTIAQDGSV